MQLAAASAMLILGIAVLFPTPADAQASPSEDWQFRAAIYGYLPSVGGSSAFPSSGTSIDVSADAIISSLKFVFMGTFEAQRGSWGGFTDVLYVDLGQSKSGTRDLMIGGSQIPQGITADASLDIEGWLWTLAGQYEALSTPIANLDVFAGTRLLSLKEKFDWAFSADVGPFVGTGRQGISQETLENLDGIVGIKGRLIGPGHRWFVPYYFDVGTGDSQFTWQGVLGIGYALGWGEVIAAWRYVDYDFKTGTIIESLDLNGPGVAIAFRW
jgi:hypothetical protein